MNSREYVVRRTSDIVCLISPRNRLFLWRTQEKVWPPASTDLSFGEPLLLTRVKLVLTYVSVYAAYQIPLFSFSPHKRKGTFHVARKKGKKRRCETKAPIRIKKDVVHIKTGKSFMKFGVQQWSHGAAGCSANAEALSSIISAVKNIWRLSAGKTINAFIRDQKLLSFPFCLVFRIPPSIRRQRRVPFYFLDVHRGVSFNSLGLFHIIKATRNRQQCLALHTTRRPLPASFSRFGFDPIWTMNRGRRKNEAPVGEMRKRGIKDGKKEGNRRTTRNRVKWELGTRDRETEGRKGKREA